MIMSDLPQDVVEEIISRVPATYSKRLRSTCKRWNALFKDQRFIEKHFRKSASPSLVLVLKKLKVFSMRASLNVADPSIELKVPLVRNDSHSSLEQVIIFQVFHCAGLLLCRTKIDDRLLVWNPCLGKTRWIQTKTDHKRYSRFALGYESNKSCPRFKILRCYQQNLKFVGSEIYEFSSDSWRVLDVVALDCNIKSNGVALKGNAYWPAIDSTDHSSKFLLSFDFTTEKFRRMCLPTFQNPVNGRNIAISVVTEERLSVLHLSLINTPNMEIWVTNKIDAEAALSWSKSFAVDLPVHHGYDFYSLTSFLIDEEKKVAVCCSCYTTGLVPNTKLAFIIDKYNTKMELVETTHVPWIPFIYSYVPSLVQIQ